MLSKLTDFVKKYAWEVHTFLFIWNSFIISWATGESIPLNTIGIPFSINARVVVSYVQAHTHIPTSMVWVGAFAVNATLMYLNWRKSHGSVSVNIDVPDVPIPPVSVQVNTIPVPQAPPALQSKNVAVSTISKSDAVANKGK